MPDTLPGTLCSVGKTPAGADNEEEAETLVADAEADPLKDVAAADACVPVTLLVPLEIMDVG